MGHERATRHERVKHEITVMWGKQWYIRQPPSISTSFSFPPTMVDIAYRQYTGEADLPHIISLVEHELSEPYVIYTYRYFLNQWYTPSLSYFRPNDSPRLT